MKFNLAWHGCLMSWVIIAPSLWGDVPFTPVISSSVHLDIAYQVNDSALPLDRVDLWYTLDRGQHWTHYGTDDDRQSPVTFRAQEEGLHGFFIVVTNAAGSSSGAPVGGAEPQQWAFIDFTPPIVQLHELRTTDLPGRTAIQIRWTALDTHLGTRPIEIAFQVPSEPGWQSVLVEPISNTGCYDWRIPEGLEGPVSVCVKAWDRAGNYAISNVKTVEIRQVASVAIETVPTFMGAMSGADYPVPEAMYATSGTMEAMPGDRRVTPGSADANAVVSHLSPAWVREGNWTSQTLNSAALPSSAEPVSRGKVNPRRPELPSAQARERAIRLFADGLSFRDAGRDREAISRMREAVKLNPNLTEAFAETGAIFYRMDDWDRALSAYEAALAQDPAMRAGLRGAAMVYHKKQQNDKASNLLRTVLRYNPNDAEVWMDLGDLAVFQGDQVFARECYVRATQIDPEAQEVIDGARRRLDLMARSSFAPGGEKP